MRILSIANPKGGCGKSTTAINLSAALASRGRRVCLADLDPQGHATLGCGVNAGELKQSLADALNPDESKRRPLAGVLTPTGYGVDLAPAAEGLAAFAAEPPGSPECCLRLRKALFALDPGPDYVVIDCPPGLGPLTDNGLCAAGEILIPVDMSRFAIQGADRLLARVEQMEQRFGHRPHCYILPVMVDSRSVFAEAMVARIREHFGDRVLGGVIHSSAKIREATNRGKPVMAYRSRAKVSHDFLRLAREVESLSSNAEAARLTMEAQRSLMPHLDGDRVVFTFEEPHARQVRLAGDFNDWNPDQTPLEGPDASGLWRVAMPLSPGEYRYRYVVDNNWTPDPANPEARTNEFGELNSILRLKS